MVQTKCARCSLLMCCGQRPDSPAAKSRVLNQSERGRPEHSGARLSKSGKPEVRRVTQSKPWKVGLLSSRSWSGHLFAESHSHRRVGPWRCRRIQVPLSFLRRSWFLPEGCSGPLQPLFAHSSHVIEGEGRGGEGGGGPFAVLLATPFTKKDGVRSDS